MGRIIPRPRPVLCPAARTSQEPSSFIKYYRAADGTAIVEPGNTPPRLKPCGFWASPPSGELGAQGPVPSLERPEGRSWVPLFLLVEVLRRGLPTATGNTEFPKSRTGGASNGLVGTL